LKSDERSLRIAMVAACPMPARRGTPLRVERLAQALAARGHDVEVITYHLAEEEAQYDFPIRRIFDRIELGTLAPGPTLAKLSIYDPALARLVGRRLRERPFDIVHAHHFEGLLAAAYGRRGTQVPIVYDAHTMLGAELPAYGKQWMAKLARGFGRRLDQWIPALADHMIVVTDDISRQLSGRHGFDPHRITVVANGVETASFGQIGVGSEEPGLLVYTGTLAAYQGIDLMLEAFAAALKMRPNLRLRLLITANFDPFWPMAERLGVARAIEIVQDNFPALPARLAEASVALMPRVECPGLPQKLLNYMAAGKAIVSFAGSAKLLEHEVTGLIVPNRDIAAFAQAIVRLTDDPALSRRLGAAARDLILETSSWDKAAERCEGVYARVLGARPLANAAPESDAAGLCRLPPATMRREEQVTPVP
jgi:glycosyltransferase involved in cell wall biosynthesis